MKETVHRLLEKMVPDPASCLEAAMRLRADHPSDTPEELARRAIQSARKAGAGVGAATGIATNPLVMLPAALADMTAMLRIEGVMAGVIAALMDPQSLDDGSLRADVVTILFPGAVSQVLRQVGVRAGEQATRSLIRKVLTEDLTKLVVRSAAKHVGKDLTRKTLMEKTVPLVGAGIGAGWNWVEVGAVGERAIRYYKGEPLQLPGTEAVGKAVNKATESIKGAVQRFFTRGRTNPGPPVPALPAPGEAQAAPPVRAARPGTATDETF